MMIPTSVILVVVLLGLFFYYVVPLIFAKAKDGEFEDIISSSKKKVSQANSIEEFEEENPNYRTKLRKVKQFKKGEK